MKFEDLTFLLETERKRLNEIFNFTLDEVNLISNQEVLSMYFTISTLLGFNLEIPEQSIEYLKILRSRGRKLREIELNKKKIEQEVVADCGCYVSNLFLMSTSTGTSCVNCYDRMSL